MTKDGDVRSQSSKDSEKIVTFPQGIPGFEKYTNYVVYHKEENDLNAYWLESCDDPEVIFTIIDPEQYGLSYELTLTDDELELLGATKAEQLGVFMVLSKKEGKGVVPSVLNANIAGPVIINPDTRLGYQKVIYRSHVNATIVEEKS